MQIYEPLQKLSRIFLLKIAFILFFSLCELYNVLQNRIININSIQIVSNELHLMTNDPINQDTVILCDKTSHFIAQYKTFFNSFQENQTKAHYIEFIYQDQYHRIPIYEGIKCIQIKEFFKTCLKTTIQLCSINKTSKFQMIVPDLFELAKFANLYCYKIVVDNLLK
ncbi:Hypothetical_protein [Hexamita inflata]|uniref:Hypothetical_protein n=1 Tax=Hexamita inflata TaxID=28002 RepID=A0ABP1H942_9EUKA